MLTAFRNDNCVMHQEFMFAGDTIKNDGYAETLQNLKARKLEEFVQTWGSFPPTRQSEASHERHRRLQRFNFCFLSWATQKTAQSVDDGDNVILLIGRTVLLLQTHDTIWSLTEVQGTRSATYSEWQGKGTGWKGIDSWQRIFFSLPHPNRF